MTSAAERQRRSRAHRRGDHSLCDVTRCDALRESKPSVSRAAKVAPRPVSSPLAAVAAVPAAAEFDERVPGGIESAVIAFVESLPYQEPDPRALLAQIAIRVAQRVDETGALPAAVRELRVLLAQLTEVPNGPSGPVDEVRLRRAARRLDQILAVA